MIRIPAWERRSTCATYVIHVTSPASAWSSGSSTSQGHRHWTRQTVGYNSPSYFQSVRINNIGRILQKKQKQNKQTKQQQKPMENNDFVM